MTVIELVAACDVAEAQGLSVTVLAAQRLRHGKRLPSPKRIDRALPVKVIGGNTLNWFVSVDIAAARLYARRRVDEYVVPLRVVSGPEKMSAELRRMCGVEDPPADPWGDSWK
jgi:hypothetical protein